MFSGKDLTCLKKWGLTDKEIDSLADMPLTLFSCIGARKRKTTYQKAYGILGREVFLSGMARAYYSGRAYRVVMSKGQKSVIMFQKGAA